MKFRSILSAVLFMILLTGIVAGQTTEFTFQGKLNDGGTSVSTPRDLRFRLWDLDVGGNQVGTDTAVANVTFSGGIFTVQIDFGQSAFTGEGRWIEVAVSLPGENAYTTLAPRQKVASVPFAVQALNAANSETATTATNSLQLGGVGASEYVQTADARMSDARTPLAGSSSYVQNQNTGPQSSTNFSIDGTGQAGILSAATQFNIGTSRILHSPGSNLFVGRSTGVNFAAGSANTIVGGTAGNGMTNASGNSIFGNAAGFDNHGSGNSFFGWQAGSTNFSGASNSFFGTGTGGVNTSGNNLTLVGAASAVGVDDLNYGTAIGAQAVVNTSDTVVLGKAAGTYGGNSRPADAVSAPGTINTNSHYRLLGDRILWTSGPLVARSLFIGLNSGASITTGNSHTFVGSNAGSSVTTSCCNSFFGGNAGRNTTGPGNAFFGEGSGSAHTIGNQNSFFGIFSGSTVTTGAYNSFLGYIAGSGTTTGEQNVFIGVDAGGGNNTGNSNTIVGANARFSGNGNTGSNNTLVGASARIPLDLTNASAIGSRANVTASNSMVLGGITGVEGGTDTNVGIGTTAPKARLDVSRGDILIGSPGQGIILKSPSGNTCVKLTIDETPNFVATTVPCP